jgi:tripartite-type tricarboxylate transporter receptor subunit TctC
MLRRTFLAAAATAALIGAASATGAAARSYPDKPIRMVVPFAPGGATDIFARLVAQKLSESLGQQVVVENKPGAGGNLGADAVAEAAPDGHTIVMGTVGTHAINGSLYASMPYDAQKDFEPVALVAAVPNVMVVNPKVPAATVQEFVDYARSRPGQVNMASSGNGTSIHMSGELFKQQTGVDMTHVPYKGSGPALTDLLGGQVQVMFDNLPPSMPHIRSGSLRALAVTSPKRSPALPDVPTVAEAGVPGYEATSWFGVFAPAGTPRPIVDRLNAEINEALASPDAKARFDEMGAEARATTPAEFRDFTRAEAAKWAQVVKASGAKVD